MNKTSEGMIQMQKQCSCKNGMEICTDCFMDHHWECHPVSKPSEEKELCGCEADEWGIEHTIEAHGIAPHSEESWEDELGQWVFDFGKTGAFYPKSGWLINRPTKEYIRDFIKGVIQAERQKVIDTLWGLHKDETSEENKIWNESLDLAIFKLKGRKGK